MINNSQIEKEKARILIIDDEVGVQGLLKVALEDRFLCDAAGSANEALEMFAKANYELVLCDIDLGSGTTGTELVQFIKKASPETVVIMISGSQGIDNAIDAMHAGAFDFIKKPFEIDYLDLVIARAVEHYLLVRSKRLHEEELEQLVRQRTDQLNYLSFFDPLTDLPNRALFEDRVSQALIASDGTDSIAIMLLSIDGLGKVQQSLGHKVSDLMLVEASKRLVAGTGENATISRFERDEFAILITNFGTEEELSSIASDIAESIRRPFDLEGNEVVATSSSGISISPTDGTDLTTLMRNASAALARAREHGGDSFRFYTAEMNARALKRLTLEAGLWRALERDEFAVLYQPKVNVSSGRIVGMEGLVRWHHPDIGMVSPTEFIPLAEETGLILPLGELVLRKAIEQAKKWKVEGFELELAINLSVRQIHQTTLASTVIEILREYDLDAEWLNLEITEGSVIENGDVARATLWALREAGIRISLDDFGTGYSSLSYLKKLPIDVIKIDKSFVNELPNNVDDASLVTTIISLGHNLRMKVVAEGVETEGQLEFLESAGCDEYQGYLFSKPVSAAGFRELLDKPTMYARPENLAIQHELVS